MNLTVDIGNTAIKVAMFNNKLLIRAAKLNSLNEVGEFVGNDIPEHTIVSTTRKEEPISLPFEYISLSQNTSLPIRLNYSTPNTLGKDRIALAVAGNMRFPNNHVLIIDCGTCITYDFVDYDGVYQGGGISPGLNMRFKAMNNFTGNLPLLEPNYKVNLIGKSTVESMQSGVLMGMAKELDGIIDEYKSIFEDLLVLITGGDGEYFANQLKNDTFADSNLLMKGLNHILMHHVNQ